jgi:hypothetical protein
MHKVLFIGVASAILLLAGCSSDPYTNAGKCANPGSSEFFEGKLAVCTGIDSKYKWYFEGKYFQDTLLLARIELNYFNFTPTFWRNNSELKPSSKVTENLRLAQPTLYDLSDFAANDSRYDELLEAKIQFDREKQTLDELSKTASTYVKAFLESNPEDFDVSVAERYKIVDAAVDAASNHRDGAYAQAKKVYEKKLEVVRVTLRSKYSMSDNEKLMVFLINYLNKNGN